MGSATRYVVWLVKAGWLKSLGVVLSVNQEIEVFVDRMEHTSCTEANPGPELACLRQAL